jgi:chloramphenicol O-acetyltransferase
MPLSRRKINHAYRVREKGSIAGFFPYLSRTRAESVIYFNKQLDITEATKFIHEKKRQGIKISLFNVLIAAIARTFHERPLLNRFILGRHLYQREVFDVSYVVKRTLTDDGDELLATVEITPDMTLDEICEKTDYRNTALRDNQDNGLDRLMQQFGSMPRPLMRLLFGVIRTLDFHGILPSFIRKELPFYCSIFISNLASISVDAPFHHLYELGTTSFFLAVGKAELKPVVNKKTKIVETRKIVNLNVTVDERICDGFYMARSLDRFMRYMENPETI